MTSVRSVAHRWLALAGAAWLAGCGQLYPAEQYPYTSTDPSTDFGAAIMEVYGSLTYMVLAIFVVVTALLAYTLVRYRDDGSPGNPEQIHGNTQLEVGWTLLPVVLVIVILVPTVRTVFQLGDAAPNGALEVRVTGKRWWWAFEYLESGVVTANELHLPAGRPVSLLIESDSVIHSFWTPRLGGKRDAVPGRINRMWFTITDPIEAGKPETYLGECAEYCGESHALMRYRVVAHENNEFEAWLEQMKKPVDLPSDPKVLAGRDAFTAGGCVGCHMLKGNDAALGVQGPDLTRFGARQILAAGARLNTPENLAQWLRDPNSVKPGTTKEANPSRAIDGMNIPVQLTDEQIDSLVAYLLAQK